MLGATMLLASMSLAADPPSPIDPQRMSAIVKTLASDAFQGRAPGTPGEAVTLAYLVDRFRALGLRPAGENGGWLQKVPLIHNVSPPRGEIRGFSPALVRGARHQPANSPAPVSRHHH
jgi:hypothetical protein